MKYSKSLQRLCLRGRLAVAIMVSSAASSLTLMALMLVLWTQHVSLALALALAAAAVLGLMTLGGLIGFYLAREVVQPMASMQAVLDTMLRGEPAPTLPFDGAPELRWLGVTIHRLRRVYMRHV